MFAGCQAHTETTQSFNAESKLQETRTVTTLKGDIEIPVNPKRIVIQAYAGDLLAMGVKPIAGDISQELFDELLKDEVYTQLADFEAETVMALDPDLIIIMEGYKSGDYDKLSKIAPTVLVDDMTMSTEERVAYMGQIVGKEEAAQQAVGRYQQLAEDSKKRLVEAGITGKTMTVMEGTYLFGEKYGRGADVVYNYLGFTAPEKLQKVFDTGERYTEVSMEVMPEYCGDYILRSVYEGAEDLSDDSIWQSMEAVKNGHVIEIDFEQFFARDIYVMSKQISYITEALLETVSSF
jgi:iron complex transport system substrate-binding protein